MARKNDYGLPDETLQLIAAGPDLINNPRYLQARQTFDSRMPGSELIKALRSYGTDNNGFTRYANDNAASPSRALGGRRGLFNPGQLGMKRIPRDVTLPGAETARVMGPLPTSPLIYPDIIDDKQIEDWPGDYVEDTPDPGDKGVAAVDTVKLDDPYTPDVSVGTLATDGGSVDSVVGGTGNDTITGGTGGGGTGGGGTGGGGDGGSGTGGTGGTGGLNGTGTTGTGTTVTTAGTGGTGNLRDAITAAMDGSASVDSTSAGLTSGTVGALTADQIAALTRPKVPNVTLTVNGGGLSLDDAGSKSQTYDYPEFLSPEELKAYEAWLATQGAPSGGTGGGGKNMFDESAANLAF